MVIEQHCGFMISAILPAIEVSAAILGKWDMRGVGQRLAITHYFSGRKYAM